MQKKFIIILFWVICYNGLTLQIFTTKIRFSPSILASSEESADPCTSASFIL